MKPHNDTEAWHAYPQHRWAFNKLDLALRLGYDAAPIVVPVQRPGKYIIRPIYNLYGMGIGAMSRSLDPVIHVEMIENHKLGPPGTFWCEYKEGPHYSIDYHKLPNGTWEGWHAMEGTFDEKDLVKFHEWTRINVPEHADDLPTWLPHDIHELNVEWRGKSIIEVHLRAGNDVLHDEPIGTTLLPVWEGDVFVGGVDGELIPNEEEGRYDANGYLHINRIGYIKKLLT